MLLEARADPALGCHAIGKDNGCLHQATLKGDAALVTLLLQHSADVNALGRDGWTPLCLAARAGHLLIAEALLAGGAAPAYRLPGGKSALDIATVNKKAPLIALLQPLTGS